MGRYQVSITKIRDEIHSAQFHRLHVEVTDLETTPRYSMKYGNAADFNILEPGVRLLRLQALKNYPAIVSRNTISVKPVENAPENEKTQLYRSELITYSPGKVVDKKSAPLWPTGKDCSDLDLRGEQSYLEINAGNLPTNKRLSHIVILDKAHGMGSGAHLDEVKEIDKNITDKVIPVEKKESEHLDSSGNIVENIPNPSSNSEPETLTPKIDKPKLEEELPGYLASGQNDGLEGQENGNPTEIVSTVCDNSTNSVIIAVGDFLVIKVELEIGLPGAETEKDTLNNNSDTTTTGQLPEPDSVVLLSSPNVRDTFFEPHDDIGIATGLHTSLLAGDYLQGRTIEDEKKKLEQRAIQKDLLIKLIFERLLMLKVSYEDAMAITNAWNKGYVQHRPFSYRIIKGDYAKPEIEKSLGGDLIESQKFASNFLHHAKVFEGILDSATCTVIESTFFLMLPHFNLQPKSDSASVRLIGAVNSHNFMQDWAQIIFTGAHQLKPLCPVSVKSLILKELKLVGKPLLAIQKVARKLKHKSTDVQVQLEKLQRKLLKRIEPQAEYMSQILQKNFAGKKVPIEHDYGRLQLPPDLTAENLFQNSMHLAIGPRGLLIKRKAEDKWFSFSDLNFLERRAVFLGTTDHMYSSFDAVLRTLRHLLELYTPGYPNNILARIEALFEDVKTENLRFMRIDPQTRMMIYQKIYAIGNSISRFENVLFQLVKMTKDVRKEFWSTKFRSGEAQEFIKKVGSDLPKAHLVVPFATLRVDKFSDLKLRGFDFEERPYPEEEGLNAQGQEDGVFPEVGETTDEETPEVGEVKDEELKDNFDGFE